MKNVRLDSMQDGGGGTESWGGVHVSGSEMVAAKYLNTDLIKQEEKRSF